MDKKELYARQYSLAKNKLSEDWKDTLSSAWEIAKNTVPTTPAEFLIPGYKPLKTYVSSKISKETKKKVDDVIDAVQTGVDVVSIPASFIPGANLVASGVDAISAGIDVEQGQYGDAALRGAAAGIGLVPGLGGAAKTGKVVAGTAKAAKATEAGIGAAKAIGGEVRAAETAVKAAQAGRATSGAAEAAEVAAKSQTRTATKTATELAPYAPKVQEPLTVTATNVRRTGGLPSRARGVRPVGRTGVKAIQVARPAARGLTKPSLRGLAKTGLAVAAGTVIGTVAKTAYDTLTGSEKDTTVKPTTQPEPTKIPAGLMHSELRSFEPGEVSGYSKSVQKGREQQDPSERFRSPWLLTPRFASIGRSMTVDSRGRIVEANDLSLKVKRAVSDYLKSKHGKELKNHLDNISKQLEK